MSTIRKAWLWVSTALVLVVSGGAATVWIVKNNTHTAADAVGSPDDCAIVARLAREWMVMVPSITNEVLNGPGEHSDIVAIADRESAMGDKLRAAADSVSAPAVKEQLNKWADGIALSARLERESANRPPGTPPPPDYHDNSLRAAVLPYEATGALMKMCPDMPRPQSD